MSLQNAIKKAQKSKAIDQATRKLQQQSTANTVGKLRSELRRNA